MPGWEEHGWSQVDDHDQGGDQCDAETWHMVSAAPATEVEHSDVVLFLSPGILAIIEVHWTPVNWNNMVKMKLKNIFQQLHIEAFLLI